jgi:hypothetical protein
MIKSVSAAVEKSLANNFACVLAKKSFRIAVKSVYDI